jgi:hypothetical protein
MLIRDHRLRKYYSVFKSVPSHSVCPRGILPKQHVPKLVNYYSALQLSDGIISYLTWPRRKQPNRVTSMEKQELTLPLQDINL